MQIKNLCTYSGLWGIMLLCVFQSCKSGNEPDVSHIKITLNSSRLDKDMAAMDTTNLPGALQQLEKKYPEFLHFYLDTLMGLGIRHDFSTSNPGIREGLKTFLTYKDFRGLFDTIQQHYPDTKSIDKELEKGFQYMKYYFPDYHVPKIIYLNSNLNNYAAFTYDTIIIGIGLDMYLGKDYPFYKSVGLPDYMMEKLTKKHIPVNVFQSIHRAKYPFEMDNNTLLDMMIQRGKEQYFLSKILPFIPVHIRLGFTQKQLEWCKNNEAAIYNFFIEKQFLYSTNLQQVQRYVTDGPNAAGMPPESPGNIGTWLGYRIIQNFVNEKSNVSLQEVLDLKNAQSILQQAAYKPK